MLRYGRWKAGFGEAVFWWYPGLVGGWDWSGSGSMRVDVFRFASQEDESQGSAIM